MECIGGGRVAKEERRNEDPIWYKDFMDFKVNVETRLTKLETEMGFTKQAVNELKETIGKVMEKIDEIKEGVDAYKKWIVLSLIGGLVGSTVFLVIVKMIFGGG